MGQSTLNFSNPELFFTEVTRRINDSVARSASLSAAALGLCDAQDVTEFTEIISRSSANGKRLRALGAFVGAFCVKADSLTPTDIVSLDQLAAALEFYQACALLHDDIIDQATTRRGNPAAHEALRTHHRAGNWLGESQHFGVAGAILAGDFADAAANWCLGVLGEDLGNTAVSTRFAAMAGEVAVGQYLDLKATHLPLSSLDPLATSLEVVRLKSARYSVSHPLALGALVAGATPSRADAIGAAFEPAGIAFQLRDDYLGTFGVPTATGKPVGGDIRERKRTALLALAYRDCPEEERKTLEEVYSSPSVPTSKQCQAVSDILRKFGVPAQEELIEKLHQDTLMRLGDLGLFEAQMPLLQSFVARLIERDA